MKNKEIIEAALQYAERGWAVFPVSKEKHPLTENGFKDATTDSAIIKEWFNHFSGANIGIATGQVSGGLIIIDVDIDESKGKFGNESLDEWCEENGCYFSETLTATTGRGGKHYYFQSSEVFGCKVGALKDVDIRGEGGYVVAPPSRHKNGMYYKWDDEDAEIVSVQSDSDVEYFLHECFKNDRGGEKFEVPDAVESGSRNDTLFKIASSFQAQGLTDENIIASVKAYNLANCNPPLPEREVESILHSVLHRYEKGRKKEEANPSTPSDAPVPTERKRITKRKLKKAHDLVEKDLPEPIVYVGLDREDPMLVEGTCILSAKPKLGKSWFVLGLCLAICNGDDFLGYRTRKCSCLYLDLETSESLQKKRLLKALHGAEVPENFYLDTEIESIEDGFVEQIENYLNQDPNIGVVIVDVMQFIRTKQDVKSKENEYNHAYRDIVPLNRLAQERHISIILVCHDRKMVDEDDPFANILGSTGLQGAVSQMIVMFRKKSTNYINIAIKGKTIDALPILHAQLEEGQWKEVSGDLAQMETERMYSEFITSDIRIACDKISDTGEFRGSCSDIISKAADLGYALTASPMQVGHFIKKFRPYFLKFDSVELTPVDNGSGAKLYKIKKKPLITVDTVDETVDDMAVTVDGTVDETLRKQGFIRVC